MSKYEPPVVKPRLGVHPAQIAAEQAALRSPGNSREAALKAYSDTLKAMGEKPVIPD